MNNPNGIPAKEDWLLMYGNTLRRNLSMVELFSEVTKLFSGTKYPTANLYFPKICEIKLSIYEWKNSAFDVIKNMAAGMIENYEKYWSHVHGIMGVATVLDPRYKMKLIEYWFSLIYDEKDAEFEIARIRTICNNLVAEYRLEFGEVGVCSVPPVRQTQSETGDVRVAKVDHMARFDMFVSKTKRTGHVKTELDHYLEEDVLPRNDNFDILNWWKANSTKYPILHRIARDIIAIPVSTIASESAFSTSGRFLSPHRSRLHPNTLEALICTQDWLWTQADEWQHSLYFLHIWKIWC